MEKRGSWLGVQKRKPLKSTESKKKKKRFLKKLVEYLKYDCYMYAPVISIPSPSPSPSKGVSSEQRGKRKEQTSAKRANLFEQQQSMEAPDSETEDMGRDHFGRQEMVKHIVHHRTRVMASPRNDDDDPIRFLDGTASDLSDLGSKRVKWAT